MNEAFGRVLAAPADDRRGLFVDTARRLGSNERYVEKDFWVCWALDALFNDRPAGEPRLLFASGSFQDAYVPSTTSNIGVYIGRSWGERAIGVRSKQDWKLHPEK